MSLLVCAPLAPVTTSSPAKRRGCAVDDDMEYEEEGEDAEDEEWLVSDGRDLPSGLTLASVVWNLLTFTSDCLLAFDKLVRNFRADVEIRAARKKADKEFMSSVEAGIESLG